jgi:hypothetical protein
MLRQVPGGGDDFLVVITHPNKIAAGPFQGTDIADDQSGY